MPGSPLQMMLLLQEADVLDSPQGELIDLKKLEQDALQRQVALSQLTVSIRDAATLLAAQPSFKAAARLSRLRNQLADLQVGDYGAIVTLSMLPVSQRATSAGWCRIGLAAACHAFALLTYVYPACSKRYSRAECSSTSCLSRCCFANRRGTHRPQWVSVVTGGPC